MPLAHSREMTSLLVLHVALGSFTLVSAPAAFVTRKGGAWHARWGGAYVASLIVVCATGAAISLLRGYAGMLTVPLPAFVFVVTGARAARRRSIRVDGAIAAALLALAVGVCVVAVAHWRAGDADAGANLPCGLWAASCCVLDLTRAARGGLGASRRIAVHRARMILSYATTVTAFAVTNLHSLPPLVTALGPTALALLAIIALERRRRVTSAPCPDPRMG